MTASYVGIDLKYNNAVFWKKTTPIVQIMLYQFHVKPKHSPILRLRPEDGKVFKNTIESIKALWDDGEEVNSFDELINKIETMRKKEYDCI